MDVYCVKCGEPWDIDSLHEEAEVRQQMGHPQATFAVVRDDFYSLGCVALQTAFGTLECEQQDSLGADGRLSESAAMGVLAGLLGDDIDGVASMMEDYFA